MTNLAGIAGGRRRARGGPVAPGVPYLVGEHEAEVFTPRTSGTVSPMGGTIIIQEIALNVYPPLAAQRGAVGREIVEHLYEYKQGGGRLPTP
jgi:hypothetical protein